MSALDTLLEQALQLPDEERGELATRLLRTLDAEGEALSAEAWNDAWSQEIDRRIREIRAGRVELVDGQQVAAELRALVDVP